MALTFEEFDQAAAAPANKSSAMTFDEFSPESGFDREALGNAIMNPIGTILQKSGMGDVVAGAVKGASNIGATLLTPVDWALNKAGITDMTNAERRTASTDALRELGADPESGAFKTGEIGAEVAGTAGVGGLLAKGVRAVAPSMTKLPAALESFGATVGKPAASFGEKVGNAAIRVGSGAAAGAAGAGMIDPESAGTGAAIGAALPVVGPILAGAAKGGGWLSDAIRGRLGAIKAGEIAREVAGPELATIRAANDIMGPQKAAGSTAAQAAAGVDRDTWQALAKMAERNDPESYYRLLADKQEAARRVALQGVTPDLAQSQAARTAADLVNYPAAEAVTFKADPALAQMAQNPYFKKAEASISDLMSAQNIDFKTNPTGYLNAVKFGFDKILGATGDTALSGAEKRVVYDLKNSLMSWMERKNPLYAQARASHAKLSEPVNQAQILEEMQSVLQRGGGGERVAPFLNAMGRGENALLKRADQSPRFGGVEDILTPDQLAVRGNIADELIRDRTIAERATAGEGGLRNIIKKDSGLLKLPAYLSIAASTTNKGIAALETKISRGTMAAIVDGMRSGQNANEMLAAIPASERNAALMWITRGGPQRFLGPVAASQSAE